jgi:hypothetical protein
MSAFTWRDWENEENLTTVGVQADVRTENLPITSQECYYMANLKF